MCDAVTLATISAISAGVGAAGTAATTIGSMNAQKKQEQEVDAWNRTQTKFREAEQVRQEDYRKGAETAQQQGLQDVSAELQKARQAEEEARLAEYLTTAEANPEAGVPLSAADPLISGYEGGDENFKTDMAKKISEASTGAKQRLAALAKVSSFGDSFGGLGTSNPILQASAGSAIDRQNEFRRGSLGAYNVERAIEPNQISYNDNGLGDVFSAALSFGGQGLGKAASDAGGWGTLFTSPTKKDAWAGLRNITTPATAPIPLFR